MALRDRSEQARKAALRRPRYRFERGVRVRARTCDDKRWAWQRYVWNKYGLAAWDIALMWDHQYGRCPICGADLWTKKWVIDHQHIRGYAKLPPEKKRLFFRGILDNWCNHRVLSMCERAGEKRVRNLVRYLQWSH